VPERLTRSARSLLEVAGICGLAIAQPVLADFGAAPDWFVFHGVSSGAIVAFGVAVALGPPLAIWAVTQLAGLGSEGRRRLAVSVAVGALVGLLLAQLLVDLPEPAWATLVAAGAVGAGYAHHRWAAVRLWAAWLALMPLFVLWVFLTQSPVSGLVTGDDVDAAELGAFGSGEPPPIVMVVFDEWPLASIVRTDGTIDAERYPNLAELAGGSTWYRDTTTAANLTNFAVPALLTGNEPEDGARADASSHPENLFTLLGGTYELDVTERITRLCPPSLCETDQAEAAGGGETAGLGDLLAEALDLLGDRLDEGERSAPVTDVFVEPDAAVDEARADTGEEVLDDLLDRRPESLDRFLRGIRPNEPPTLHFLHLLAPHTPHRHLADGHQYEADPAPRGIADDDVRTLAEAPALLDRQRLQEEVAHVDRLVGDLLDRLRATGLYDEALVVVTSDHGIAFRPGRTVRGLNEEPIDPAVQPELLWVPLFVKAPGQAEGVVSDLPASTIDVVPTLAAHLGIDLPWAVDGRDLTEPVDADRDRRFRHVVGSSFATFTLDPPASVEADLAEVLALGVDADGVLPDARQIGRQARGTPVLAQLDDLGPFLDVDLDDVVIPAVVSGRVGPGIERVAIAVNGRVAAVVGTYNDAEGPGRFAALVPPDLLVDGVNDVKVTLP
jgi:hypothetical protein